jgi:tryptophanase
MRKFFSQKSKHKAHQHQTLTGSSSLVVSPLPLNKDDETGTKKSKSQTTSSHSQVITTNPTDILIDSTLNESITSELKQDENIEKSKKLFVVVSGKKIFLITYFFSNNTKF